MSRDHHQQRQRPHRLERGRETAHDDAGERWREGRGPHEERGHGRRHHDERERGGRAHHDGERGPQGTEFLDLEISQVIAGEAAALTREVVRELLREALRGRIRERLGERLDAVARVAADAFVDDVEASLAVEARIQQRQALGADQAARLRAAMTSQPTDASERPAKRRR